LVKKCAIIVGILIFFSFPVQSSQAKIFKWVDQFGRVHYSNTGFPKVDMPKQKPAPVAAAQPAKTTENMKAKQQPPAPAAAVAVEADDGAAKVPDSPASASVGKVFPKLPPFLKGFSFFGDQENNTGRFNMPKFPPITKKSITPRY